MPEPPIMQAAFLHKAVFQYWLGRTFIGRFIAVATCAGMRAISASGNISDATNDSCS